jgi:hypothetical protein
MIDASSHLSIKTISNYIKQYLNAAQTSVPLPRLHPHRRTG